MAGVFPVEMAVSWFGFPVVVVAEEEGNEAEGVL